MRGLLVAVVVAAVFTLNARTAEAQQTEWYGWKLLTADGVSTAVVLGGLKTSGKAGAVIIITGVLGLVWAPPILHGLEDGVSTKTTLASLGLRLGLPTLGGLALAALMGRNEGGAHGNVFGGVAGAIIGAGLGMLTAIVIDDFVLARKDSSTSAPRVLRLTFAF